MRIISYHEVLEKVKKILIVGACFTVAYLVARDPDLLRERGFDGKEGVELTSKSIGIGLASDITFGVSWPPLSASASVCGCSISPCRPALLELASPQPVCCGLSPPTFWLLRLLWCLLDRFLSEEFVKQIIFLSQSWVTGHLKISCPGTGVSSSAKHGSAPQLSTDAVDEHFPLHWSV